MRQKIWEIIKKASVAKANRVGEGHVSDSWPQLGIRPLITANLESAFLAEKPRRK